MKITTIQLTHDMLPESFTRLEATLLYWQHLDAGIWPIKEWEEAGLIAYIQKLYQLVHECLAMQLRVNAPRIVPYLSDAEDTISKIQLIHLTRQFIYCCDREIIGGYRCLSPEEERLITTLRQIHSALIGSVYLELTGQDRLTTVYFR